MESHSNGDLPPENSTPAKQSNWKTRVFNYFVISLIVMLLAAIAIPNFVKARTTTCKSACIGNLKQIDGAKEQWALENKKTIGSTADLEGVASFLKGRVIPPCPGGGAYAVNLVGSNPTCSLKYEDGSGHSLN